MSLNITLCPLPASGNAFVDAILRDILDTAGNATKDSSDQGLCYRLVAPSQNAIDNFSDTDEGHWIFLIRDLRDVLPQFAQVLLDLGPPTVPSGYSLADTIEMVTSHALPIAVRILLELSRKHCGVWIRFEDVAAEPKAAIASALAQLQLKFDVSALESSIERHRNLLCSDNVQKRDRHYLDSEISNLFRIFLGTEQLALGYRLDDLESQRQPLDKGLSFFTAHRRPYYIWADDYSHTSAGIRCLHYLCHALNELGEDAFIAPAQILNPSLRTKTLTIDIVRQHFLSGRKPIALYPEIVIGNPLAAPVVARWLLNRPGHIGGSNELSADELHFHFARWCLPESDLNSLILNLPTVDTSIFNNLNNPTDQSRRGTCYYTHKHRHFGGVIGREIPCDALNLGHEIPRSAHELAKIFRQSEALYCFESSSIIPEALACGCPVLIVPSDYWDQHGDPEIFKQKGVVLASEPDAQAIATAEIADYVCINDETANYYWWQVERFVATTQASTAIAKDSLWEAPQGHRQQLLPRLERIYVEQLGSNADTSLTSQFTHTQYFAEASYQWLSERNIETHNDRAPAIAKCVAANWKTHPRFHVIVRLESSASNALADTVDSLNRQLHENWHFDIVSLLPSPDVIDEIPFIDWHTVRDARESKKTIDTLVASRDYDWIIELPAGASLDHLCLWRIADEADRHPEFSTFYVDDFIVDRDSESVEARFKPGVNPEWLRSADLAGPIFVRRDVWSAIGGASPRDGSPWFSQLLRIAEQLGWSSIKHVPDVLISYSDAFPRATESCLLGLVEHLKNKGIDGEIVPVTGQSWCIRYPMQTTPTISIAIISRGQLDLLSRCFDSIVAKTSYPHFEFIVVVGDDHDEPDLNSWLAGLKQSTRHVTCVIRTVKSANHATRCNAAVQASSNEFVLLIREEAVIIQEKWLEELVRTCLQPDIAAVAPCLIAPGTSKIEEAGSVIGLKDLVGSPYQGEARLGDSGYLDYLRIAHDVSALSGACLLLRASAYLAVGGMDEKDLGNYFADTDLCQKLRGPTRRLIYQPLATVVFGGATSLDIDSDPESAAQDALAKAHASREFSQRWLTTTATDTFWNPNLSLAKLTPMPETDYRAQWQYLPSAAPLILARSFANGESFFRIDSFLTASRKAGLASECYWPQDKREPSAAELLRLAPSTVIVQHYLKNSQLAALQDWNTLPDRPFVVYTIDDLMTNMAQSNSLRLNIPANCRTRLKYALERCDRMVVSTEFLAESYRHFIDDIRVVPNLLAQETWLPLQSRKRTGKKPRIGWAGGRTHWDDLQLLKETIEKTRGEADWVFFGMCPDEIRPLLAEFHPYTNFAEYPSAWPH
jgi:GT2 family glycosyltransferase